MKLKSPKTNKNEGEHLKTEASTIKNIQNYRKPKPTKFIWKGVQLLQ